MENNPDVSQTHSLGEALDKISQSEGYTQPSETRADHSSPTPPPPPPPAEEYIKALDGEKEILIPKSAKVHLSTKAGDEMELSVKDWADAPWSKREASRLVNEKVNLEKNYYKLADTYKEIENLMSPEAKDFKGAEWTAQALKALYNLNPERGEDIAAFVDAIKTNGLSDERLKQSELQKKNIELEKANKARESSLGYEAVSDYSANLSQHLLESLGVDEHSLDSKIKSLASAGQVGAITDVNSANEAASIVFTHVLYDKAVGAFDMLKLSPQEVEKCKADVVGLLQANPRQSVPELAQKIGALMGKSSGDAQLARDKVERFKETSGRRPESITPKPLRTDTKIDTRNMSPFSYLERTTGIKFN